MCLDKKIRISACLIIVYTLYVVLKKRYYFQWSKQCVEKNALQMDLSPGLLDE